MTDAEGSGGLLSGGGSPLLREPKGCHGPVTATPRCSGNCPRPGGGSLFLPVTRPKEKTGNHKNVRFTGEPG